MGSVGIGEYFAVVYCLNSVASKFQLLVLYMRKWMKTDGKYKIIARMLSSCLLTLSQAELFSCCR